MALGSAVLDLTHLARGIDPWQRQVGNLGERPAVCG